MTVIGALSSFRELGEMSPHKRAQRHIDPWFPTHGVIQIRVG
jgi:hypothetical protein